MVISSQTLWMEFAWPPSRRAKIYLAEGKVQ
jgi:hypothetical protein